MCREDKKEDKPEYEYVSGETIQHWIVCFYTTVNDMIQHLRDASSMKDTKKMFAVLGGLFFISTLSMMFSDFMLLWIGTEFVE